MNIKLSKMAARQALSLSRTLSARAQQRRSLYSQTLALVPRCEGFELKGGKVVREWETEGVEISVSKSRPEVSQNPYSREKISIFQRQFAQQLEFAVPPESRSQLVETLHQAALNTANPFGLPQLPPLHFQILVYKSRPSERTTLYCKQELGHVKLQCVGVGEERGLVWVDVLPEQAQRTLSKYLSKWQMGPKLFLMLRMLSHLQWENQSILELEACSTALEALASLK